MLTSETQRSVKHFGDAQAAQGREGETDVGGDRAPDSTRHTKRGPRAAGARTGRRSREVLGGADEAGPPAERAAHGRCAGAELQEVAGGQGAVPRVRARSITTP